MNTTKCLGYNIKIQFKGEEMVQKEKKKTVLHFHPISDTPQWALQSAETLEGFRRHSFTSFCSVYNVASSHLSL